ncbi:MAG: hypothetical protein HDR97_06115 [Bacteroides sp.]|nr:hypothetical protein [Bacteroides sp.]MBD5333292.1 hypothetical protein [Bacteroides sp.]
MNDNNSSLERIENPSTQLTMADVHALAGKAENMLGMVTNSVNNVALSATEIAKISADVEIQCKQLETAFNSFMVKAQRDIKLYEMSLPLLDKRFDNCQKTLDKLTDKALELIDEDFSDATLAKQEFLMSNIERVNDTFNSLIAKLIPSY